METASLEAVGDEFLKNTVGFEKHPKLQNVTSKLLFKFTTKNGVDDNVILYFLRVGASRVFFSSSELMQPYVVKIARVSHVDDNASEFMASGVLPQWLVPQVFYFGHQSLCGESISFLVVARFEATIGDTILKVQTLDFNIEHFKHYVKIICAVFLLISRVATETNLEISDWHVDNLALSQWPEGDVRLIDWAGTNANDASGAYTRVKKARTTFLRYLPGLSASGIFSMQARKWLELQEKMTLYMAKSWWPPGWFSDSPVDGVPAEADIRKLQTTLQSFFPEEAFFREDVEAVFDASALSISHVDAQVLPPTSTPYTLHESNGAASSSLAPGGDSIGIEPRAWPNVRALTLETVAVEKARVPGVIQQESWSEAVFEASTASKSCVEAEVMLPKSTPHLFLEPENVFEASTASKSRVETEVMLPKSTPQLFLEPENGASSSFSPIEDSAGKEPRACPNVRAPTLETLSLNKELEPEVLEEKSWGDRMKAVYRRRGERRRSVSIADWEETVLNLNVRCDVEANEKVVCETAEFRRVPNRLPRTNGSIALDRRIDTENLDYVPRAYFRDVGDDLGLFSDSSCITCHWKELALCGRPRKIFGNYLRPRILYNFIVSTRESSVSSWV